MALARLNDDWARASLIAATMRNAMTTKKKDLISLDAFNPFKETKSQPSKAKMESQWAALHEAFD